jgi:hypothetical protein
MYSIIYNDKGVEQVLGTFKTLKIASKRINNPLLLFKIPLGKRLLNQYKRKSYIQDDKTRGKFFHIYH